MIRSAITLRRYIVRAPLALCQGLGGDLKMAARRLLAAPLFTIFAMVSLALGIGVTTAAYSVVDRLFWNNTGIPGSDRLVLVVQADTLNGVPTLISTPDFEDLRSAQTSFSELAASAPVYPAVAAPLATEFQAAEGVDGSYFRLLGIHAAIGRVIEAADDTQAAAVVVLSDSLWKTRFAADPHVLGRTVRLSGRPFEIIGVAPASFGGPVGGPMYPRASRLWVPLGAAASFYASVSRTAPERDRGRLMMIGLLRPGVTAQRATSELTTLGARLDLAFPPRRTLGQAVHSRRLWKARRVDDATAEQTFMRRFGTVVLGVVALVLLVACTNLANLVLARGATRQHELAVRCALGASRWRLVREQCAESALVAIGGAAVSAIVIQILIRALDVEVPIAASYLVSVQPEVNATALAAAGAALLLSLVVFGLEPALQLTRKKGLRQDLEAGAGGRTVPKASRQRALLRWQVAVCAGFFIIGSLCVRYMVDEAHHDSGVDVDRLALAGLDFQTQRWDETRARRALERVLEQARRLPGVEAAAVSTGMPFGTMTSMDVEMATPDRPITPDSGDHDYATFIAASPGFFRTAGISILRGRGFDDRDDAKGPSVLVVSESAARSMFGTVDAVGRTMLVKIDFRGWKPEQPVKEATVVGVAEDTDTTRYQLRGGATVYAPFTQEYFPFVTLLARAADPAKAVGALRVAGRKAEPDLALDHVATGREMLTGMDRMVRALGVAAVSLGGIALLLAMVGLYGVQSQIVTHRTSEIGVRMSLGATARQIERMVLKDGYRPVLEGLGIGLFIGLAARAVLHSFNAPLAILDPWMLMLVPVPLVAAAFWACYLPARRASRVDPNVALRRL